MNVAIVLAAGSGSRMKSDIPKQFMLLNGYEVIYYCLNVMQKSNNIDEIILVTKDEDIEYCQKEIVDRYLFGKVKEIISGGKERYDSVYNGLLCAKQRGADIVMIHDAARPLISQRMISDSIEATMSYGASTVAMPVKDTIKIVEENDDGIFGRTTPDRNLLYQIQTPQTFKLELLMDAYLKLKDSGNYNITDDTMIVEQYADVPVKIVPGAYENLKITTPEDILIAENLLKKNIKKTEKNC